MSAVTTTPEESAALAKRVYETLFNGTESFVGIGHHIAYLVGGILTNTPLEFFQPLEETEEEFIELLHDLFESDDNVWYCVRVSSLEPEIT